MTDITLRATKGSPLTHAEVDANFTNLKTTADDNATDIAALATKAETAALGVAASDTNMGSYTGATITDSQTAKQNIQQLETAVETKANASAVGVTASAANMGTYTGSTITDNQTAKQNLQELETAVELRTTIASLAASTGAALVGWIQTGTGAVARWVRDKLRERVTPQDFGAVGDGVADDTAAMNLYFTAIAAGKKGRSARATYKITSALTAVSAHDFCIEMDEGSVIVYTGASTTPGDLITIGDGASDYRRITLKGFRIDSTTTLTAGRAVRIRRGVKVDVDCMFGDEYGTWKLYDGLWLDTCTDMRMHSSGFFCLHTGLAWSDGYELHMMNSTVKGLPSGGHGTGTGILLGGGCGGFYSEGVTQLLNDIGLRVDTSISATGNTHIFCQTGSFDTNKTAAISLDDSTSNAVSKVIDIGAWVASSTSGAGLVVANWTGGTIKINGKFVNHSASAIYGADNTVRLIIGRDAVLGYNGAYAVDASVAWTISSDALPYQNTSGNYSSNITLSNIRYGGQALNYNPATYWGIDFTNFGVTAVAAAAHLTMPAGSGLVVVHNDSNGDAALFLAYAGGTTKIAGAAAIVAGAPGASEIGFNYSGGFYRATNGYASSQNLYLASMKTRPTS